MIQNVRYYFIIICLDINSLRPMFPGLGSGTSNWQPFSQNFRCRFPFHLMEMFPYICTYAERVLCYGTFVITFTQPLILIHILTPLYNYTHIIHYRYLPYKYTIFSCPFLHLIPGRKTTLIYGWENSFVYHIYMACAYFGFIERISSNWKNFKLRKKNFSDQPSFGGLYMRHR